MGDGDRLCILAARVAGRRVADMADRHGARHPVERFLVENGADQTDILMAVNDAVLVYGDAGCLLTAVLQCEQRGVGVVVAEISLALGLNRDAEYATLCAAMTVLLCLSIRYLPILAFSCPCAQHLPMTRFMILLMILFDAPESRRKRSCRASPWWSCPTGGRYPGRSRPSERSCRRRSCRTRA